MKIAVTARGSELESEVDSRFGRAAWFIVVDTETGAYEAVDNSAGVEASSGAGVEAARKLVDRGVEAVLTGHCGPNAFRVLRAAGIEVVLGASGTVAEATEAFKEGRLSPAADPDVAGH